MTSDKYMSALEKLNLITNNNIAQHNQSLREAADLVCTLKEDMIKMENEINNFSENYGTESSAKSKLNVDFMLEGIRKIREGVELNEAKIRLMFVPQDNKTDEEAKDLLKMYGSEF